MKESKNKYINLIIFRPVIVTSIIVFHSVFCKLIRNSHTTLFAMMLDSCDMLFSEVLNIISAVCELSTAFRNATGG